MVAFYHQKLTADSYSTELLTSWDSVSYVLISIEISVLNFSSFIIKELRNDFQHRKGYTLAMQKAKTLILFTLVTILISISGNVPAGFAVVMEGDAADSGKDAPQFVPGDIIIKYTLKNGLSARGPAIEREHQRVINTISQAYNLPLKTQEGNKKYRPIHEPLIQRMKKENKTENDLTEATFRKRAQKDPALAKKMSQRSFSIKDYGLTRKLLIQLSDPNLDVKEVIERLKDQGPLRNTDIESIEAYPNHIYTAQFIPNDPQFPEQWGLHNTGQTGGTPDADIDAPEAWDISQGSAKAVIAVIDSGVDYNHEDLAQNIWVNPDEDINHNGIVDSSDFNGIDDDADGDGVTNELVDDIRGWDFVEYGGFWCAESEDCLWRDNDPLDVAGHGTHVSGIAAAVTNNGIGIAGACPSCKIMATRAGSLDIFGSVSFFESDVCQAILYAVNNGADVINMSFGSQHEATYLDELQMAYATNVVLVASAGNSNTSTKSYPAAYEEVIAVAAVDDNGQRSIWDTLSASNYGDWVDIAAPGTNILSTLTSDSYESWSGTSMASPHVTGVAALLRSTFPSLPVELVKWILVSFAAPFSPPNDLPIGNGLLNAEQAALTISTGLPLIVVVDYEEIHDGFYVMPGDEWELSLRVAAFNIGIPFVATLTTNDPKIEFVSSQAEFSAEEVPYYAHNHNSKFRLRNTGADALIGEIEFTLHIEGLNLPFTIDFDIVTLPGWPKTTDDGVYSSPAVADLDGDGLLEVIVGSDDHNIYAWHRDGTPVSGWPQTTGGAVFSSPAIVDLNDDGLLEVVVGSGDRKVYAWHGNGTPVPGWPQTTGGVITASSPVAADLDGDGLLEVIVGSTDTKVYVWQSDGTLVTGWPKTTGGGVHSSPAVADLDGDGLLEVIVGSYDHNIYAWHRDGTSVAGWPKVTGNIVVSSPAVADLDGDGLLEVIVGSYGTVSAWHSNGASVQGWPETGGNASSSPAVADLDGNGTLEVAVGYADGKVYAWTLPYQTYDTNPWPMFRHDPQHTGLYTPPVNHEPEWFGVDTNFDDQPDALPVQLHSDKTARFNVLFDDADANDSLTLTMQAGPGLQNAYFDGTKFSWTATETDLSRSVTPVGYYDVRFTADDGRGGAVQSPPVTISVPQNRAPQFISDLPNTLQVHVWDLIDFTLNASDPNKDPVTYHPGYTCITSAIPCPIGQECPPTLPEEPVCYTTSLPAGSTFTDVLIDRKKQKRFTWRPLETNTCSGSGVCPMDMLSFYASDRGPVVFDVDGLLVDDLIINPAARLIDEDGTQVTVTNEAPVIAPLPQNPILTRAGVPLSFILSASDAHNDSFVVSASGVPTSASFDQGTLTFNWLSPIAGSYPITFTAQDYFMDNQNNMHLGMTSDHKVQLTIDGQAPTATITSPNSCTTSTLPEFRANVSDNIALANATVSLYRRSSRGLTFIFSTNVTLSGTSTTISGIKPSTVLKRDRYRYTITLRDAVGNVGQSYKDFSVASSCK